ncbi:MAG TPA: hypothetical protein EYP63_06000 [Desulfotomaculum sp.]|nr:hypothetical protein [Desulfotomaculum sp.]
MPNSREVASEIQQQFFYADAWRQQYDERALKYWKLFNGYREPLLRELAGRSNLHIPKTYEIVDSLRARYLKALFGSGRIIEYMPNPLLYFQEGMSPDEYLRMLETAEDSAKYATYLVDRQLRSSRVYRQFYDWITAFLVMPCGVLSVGWKYEVKKTKRYGMVWDKRYGTLVPGIVEEDVVTYDDNEVKYIDYFDFWPDPRGTDIDSCRFVFVREYLTKRQLEEKMNLLAEVGAGTVWGPGAGSWDWDSLAAAGSTFLDQRMDKAGQVGLTAETSQGYWQDIKKGYLFEVLHRYSDDEHSIWVNRHECVYHGENIYWHGKKPLVVTSYDPKPAEFYGFSVVELLEHLQAELNTNRNQRIDNVSFVLNRMWKVRRSADVDESQLISRPHGIIYVDTMDDVGEFTMQDITQSTYRDEAITKGDMDNTVGAPAIVRGVEPPGRETATETVTKAGAADIKFQTRIMLFEEYIDRLAEMLDMNNQQFIVNPRIFRVEEEWKIVTPEELRGHRTYRRKSIGLDFMHNQEVRRRQLLELQNLLQNSPHIDQYELLKLVLEAYGIRGTERILLPKEEATTVPAPSGSPAGTRLASGSAALDSVQQLLDAVKVQGVEV